MKSPLVPVLSLLLVASCGDEVSTTPDGGSSGFADQLTGRWASAACTPLGPSVFGRLSLDVQRGGQFTLGVTMFGEAACGTALFRSEVIGTLLVVGPSSAVPGAYEVDYPHTTLRLTALVPTMVDTFNTNRCGDRADWAINTTGDISLAGCPGLGIQGNTTCAGEHDLNRIDGTTLTFGDRSGDLCQTRPTSLGTLALVRQ